MTSWAETKAAIDKAYAAERERMERLGYNQQDHGGKFMQAYQDIAQMMTDEPTMTLRDYFAAQMMPVMMAAHPTSTSTAAYYAYLAADAMLTERAK